MDKLPLLSGVVGPTANTAPTSAHTAYNLYILSFVVKTCIEKNIFYNLYLKMSGQKAINSVTIKTYAY